MGRNPVYDVSGDCPECKHGWADCADCDGTGIACKHWKGWNRMRYRKRSVLSIAREKPRRIVQDVAAVDQFGELASRKKEAAATARELGHQMGPWHKRKQDPSGRVNAFCLDCNRPAVVCTEPPEGLPAVYGKALTVRCSRV